MTELRLYAVVLRLAATRRGSIAGDHGDQGRAALLDLIRRGDFPLASRLHDENAPKPYTISLLKGGRHDADRRQHFGEGDIADWRITLLREPAFEVLLRRYLFNRALPYVRIGTLDFAIVHAFASGTSHIDSGHTSVTDLQRRWDCPPEKLPRVITLDFESPTAFSLGTDAITGERRFRALPEPRLIFSALRKRWAKLGGTEPGDLFDAWVARQLEAEPISLVTRKTHIEQRSIMGFVGRVRLRASGDLCWLSLVNLLADLAYWTGVGYQTTRGMGQVRRHVE